MEDHTQTDVTTTDVVENPKLVEFLKNLTEAAAKLQADGIADFDIADIRVSLSSKKEREAINDLLEKHGILKRARDLADHRLAISENLVQNRNRVIDERNGQIAELKNTIVRQLTQLDEACECTGTDAQLSTARDALKLIMDIQTPDVETPERARDILAIATAAYDAITPETDDVTAEA